VALTAQQRKRIVWLVDGHLADDYDEATFQGRWEREFAALSSPEELFLFASESPADQEPAEWRRVLDSPLCDRGTALLVFWRNSPVYYYGDEPAGGWGRDRARYELVREIAERCLAGGCSSAVVRFDPAAFKRINFLVQNQATPLRAGSVSDGDAFRRLRFRLVKTVVGSCTSSAQGSGTGASAGAHASGQPWRDCATAGRCRLRLGLNDWKTGPGIACREGMRNLLHD
jgi:hypothetical protein